MTPRMLRLQERFNSIREALKEVHGQEASTAAAWCAWLQAIEFTIMTEMRILARGDREIEHRSHPRLDEFLEENRELLQGFHQELCEYLQVPHPRALELMKAFSELLNDICQQKG